MTTLFLTLAGIIGRVVVYGASISLSEGKMVVAAVIALDNEGVREEEVELLVVRMRL